MSEPAPLYTIEESGLKPDLLNANEGTQRGRGLLEKSLRKLGAGRSILTDKDGNVIAGNKTLEGAAEIGLPVRIIETDGTELVVVKRTDLDLYDGKDKRARQLAYADNKIAELDLSWKPEQIEADFAPLDLGEWGFVDPSPETADAEPQTDRAAELNEKWQVKTGDLWRIGDHRLLCGDSTVRADVERVMGGERAGFSFTDPPYNVGVVYQSETNDNQEREKFVEWCKQWAQFLPTKFCMTVGVKRLLWWRDILGDPQWTIAWVKKNGQSNTGLGGTNKWDPILVYGCQPDNNIDIVEINNDYSEKLVSGGNHPTPQPVLLWQNVISRFCKPDEIVIEFFGGTGTTMLASQNLSRKCRAIEISPNYCAVILERMATAFPDLTIERIE
jgi:DNA modification methylase